MQGLSASYTTRPLSAQHSRLRWHPQMSSPADHGLLPNVALELAESNKHLIIADLDQHRVYLLENGERQRIVLQMYATIGKNGIGKQKQDDGKTPLGVYTIVNHLLDENLPELYGSGAFPVDYPNSWDKLHLRTGYGIWLHGIPRDKFSRAPRSSEGCVAVRNEDLNSLSAFIDVGTTRAVFTRDLTWLDPQSLKQDSLEFQARLDDWLNAWNQIDTEGYLAFYARDFRNQGQSRADFVSHKRRVNANKSSIDVKLDELSVFNYPDGEKLRMVEFTQHYTSSNYSSIDRKQQFWQQSDEDGQWYILREITLAENYLGPNS